MFIFKTIPTCITLTGDSERQFGGDEPFLIIFSCVFVTFLWGSRLNDLHGQWISRKPSPHILLSCSCTVVVAVVATNRIKLFLARKDFKGGVCSLWHYVFFLAGVPIGVPIGLPFFLVDKNPFPIYHLNPLLY